MKFFRLILERVEVLIVLWVFLLLISATTLYLTVQREKQITELRNNADRFQSGHWIQLWKEIESGSEVVVEKYLDCQQLKTYDSVWVPMSNDGP